MSEVFLHYMVFVAALTMMFGATVSAGLAATHRPKPLATGVAPLQEVQVAIGPPAGLVKTQPLPLPPAAHDYMVAHVTIAGTNDVAIYPNGQAET